MNRRKFLSVTAGAGAGLALSPQLLRALRQQGGALIQRAIPSSGEMVPVIGLSFSNHPACSDHSALRDVVRTFFENGGRVFDAMHGNETAEKFHSDVANELGLQNKLFWSTRGTLPGGPGGPAQPGAAAVKAHIDTWLARTGASRMDLVMLPVAADPALLAALKEEKRAGRVRYIGVQTIAARSQSAQLESLMRNEPIDFIGVDYDVTNRGVEHTILPLALERKIGVMAFFPFGNAGGLSCTGGTSLFSRTANEPLPAWAADFDARSWAQFFAKYVVSHPAVTVARVGTTKPAHMLDNLGGGIGRLPNDATRKRMAELIDALPPVAMAAPPPAQVFQGPEGAVVLTAPVLDRYVGEYRTAAGMLLSFRRYGTMMTAKAGTDPETVIYAFSSTRFSLDRNFIEFQLDGAGAVTGLTIEQGKKKIPASRVR